MSIQASFTLRSRNPDVLTCIANLSNDEVFTPPDFANQMLDTLAAAWAADHDGADLWADPSVRFLDPCTKSGVFLREITRRLTKGLAAAIPDLNARVDHILTRQVYGIGITQLTSLLARRSLYCSKHAQGRHSIARSFASDDGNIWFERMEHTWKGDKCAYCGASRKILDRGEDLESHAYAFIHTDDIKTRVAELFGGDMQFDVIIGNPPYQLDDGGYGTSAAPIYQLFVEKALDLNPRFAVFVTPSRWMAGGKGLDKYRERMLSDKRLRNIVDYPKLYEGFPGVKIRGGISYFLWDRDYNGPCEVQTIWDGNPTGPAVARHLDAYDILVRRNEAVPILDKVRAKDELSIPSHLSSWSSLWGQLHLSLHNNPAELAARQRVRKRDISFGPRTSHGAAAWDTFMTLSETAKKLGVNFYAYIQYRISQARCMPLRAEIIQQRATVEQLQPAPT